MNKKKVSAEAKNFYRKINLLRSYVSRARYSEKYYKRWYRDVAKLDLGKESAGTNYRLPSFFPGNTSTQSVYLISPSISEIRLFSSKFKKVYFSAIPQLKGRFPRNAKQINYDNKFELPVNQIKGLKVDCAFSHHVIEHIHPDDIRKHLTQIYSLLRKGGSYLIICPSSIQIKKDAISRDFFSLVSVFHHIGRYSYTSILNLSKETGYSKCSRPIINPNLLNHFYEFKDNKCFHFFENLTRYMPDPFLSALGFGSLYIRIIK